MQVQQIIVLSSLLLLNILKVYSQEDKSLKELFLPYGYTLDRNQARFNQLKDFVLNSIPGRTSLTCIISKQFSGFYSPYCNYLLSNDSNFIVYVSAPPIYCGDKDSIYADLSLKTGFMIEVNTCHLERIKGDFFENTGERVTSLYNLPLSYKSSKYAREAFNADTVITYPLKMWQNLENKYNHCQVMIIQKNRRGCIALYCFYNDKGARKLSHYIKTLKNIFWYRVPKDYIEVIDPPIIDEYEIPHLKAKEKSADN